MQNHLTSSYLAHPVPPTTTTHPTRKPPDPSLRPQDFYPPHCSSLKGYQDDIVENGPRYVQWNLPLYDDDVLWVLPGSHVRRTSDAENAQLAAEPKLSTPLPGSIPVKLKAGDGVTRPLARLTGLCFSHLHGARSAHFPRIGEDAVVYTC